MIHERYVFRRVLAVCLATQFCCYESAVYADCIYTAGHADLRISYADDAFSLAVGIDALTTLDCDTPLPPGTTLLDPSETLVFVPETTTQVRGASSSWDIVGVEESETFYRLPQNGLFAQIEGAPFLGLNTEDVPDGVFAGNQVILALTSVVSAPEDGEFALYTGDVIPFREMDTQDGSFANDAITLPRGIHDHRNWSFSKPGRYELEFAVSGNLASTSDLRTASAVFAFQVTPVPECSTTALALIGAVLLTLHGARHRRRARPV